MPVNYQMDVANPFQTALAGYGAGAQMLQQQQAAQQQQVEQGQKSQLFGLQMQEAQGRLAALQTEREKAARAQAASAAMYGLLDQPDWAKTVTAGDIAKVMEGNPELGKYLTTEKTRLNDEQKLNAFNQNWSVSAALELGNVAQAEALLEDQAVAFENSGDPQKAATTRGMKDQLKTPEGRDIIKKSLFVNASVLDPDRFDKLRTGLTATVELPLDMKLKQAQIDRERAAARWDGMRAKAELETGAKVQSGGVIPGGDGTATMLMTDGTTRVNDPTGKLVTGEEAARTIAKANLVAMQVTGANAGARTAATNVQNLAKDAYESVGRMRSNINTLDKVADIIRKGANTGLIESQIPAWNASTLELRNLQNVLALDVVGATKFGALSEGELQLAQNVALPTNMQPNDLLKWVLDKKAAQEKLAGYLSAQAAYLSIPTIPPRTVDDWLKHLEDINKGSGGSPPATKPTVASVKVIP
jgi:hypothetical protein